MTVRETIRKYKDAGVERFKLGSGSGFVYCGQGNELVIAALSGRAKATAERERGRREYFVAMFEEKKKQIIRGKMIDNIIRWLNEYGGLAPEAGVLRSWWDDAAADAERQLAYSISHGAELRERLDRWVDFLDREILEAYPSQSEPGTMILIMEGEEIGRAWTTEEFKKGEEEK